MGVVSLQAQDAEISIGDNVLGSIDADTPEVSYAFSVTFGQTVTVQVLSLTPGFVPTLSVVDAVGAAVETLSENRSDTRTELVITAEQADTFTVQVDSASGSAGEFALSVQEGNLSLLPPSFLLPGQPVQGVVDASAPVQRFAFSAVAGETMALVVTTEDTEGDNRPTFTLKDSDTGETVALLDARLSGGRFSVPPNSGSYILEVVYGGQATSSEFSLQLLRAQDEAAAAPTQGQIQPVATEEAAAPTEEAASADETEEADVTATATTRASATATTRASATPMATSTPRVLTNGVTTLLATGDCVLTTRTDINVNVRSGPDAAFPVLTTLGSDQTVPVIGRSADGLWYRVRIATLTGWVSNEVVILGGAECDDAPLATAEAPTPTSTGGPAVTTAAATTRPNQPTSQVPQQPIFVVPTRIGPGLPGDYVVTLDPNLINQR
ncbi:MAG: SH3 domain-containing protein [Burkholderiales bacterium]|nr:SH3 domain-containing protein [Anaerolineae bacterium]